MNHSYAVYTIEAECQDCYKCVRHCPVKAIRVRDGHAAVISELCVACGKCVEVCPVKAKQVRNDTGRFRLLAQECEKNPESKIYVSLAPSWVNEFNSFQFGQMIRALKLLGVAGVSETALGAQLVSARAAQQLESGYKGILLSSACPVAVDYIRKYHAELADKITPYGSPLMAHAQFLRDTFGPGIKVVFIGPCIGKKNEADRNEKLIDLALTYSELRQLLREAQIEPEKLSPLSDDVFVPFRAMEGALYPVEGGMNETIRFISHRNDVYYDALCGLDHLKLGFDGIGEAGLDESTVFIEMLACQGGCVHGPCAEHNSPGLVERLRVLRNTEWPETPEKRTTASSIAAKFPAEAVHPAEVGAKELTEALHSIGKNVPEDELNCDSCGYDSCRNFAKALLAGKAEPSMCVSYLKKQAQKKANALLRSISSGVVIADKNLKIIECNRNFASLFGEETLTAFEACPGLPGADLRRIVPFGALFESSLKSGHDICRDSLKMGKRLLHVNIFTIDEGEVVGGVVFDVTQSELRREQIAERARQVIDKNLATVQEIACRLGEQMADTELLLRSIADNYADENNLPNEEDSL